MKRSHVLSGLTAATLAPRLAFAADAAPLRIGWVATFSGGLLELAGKAADAAVVAFFKEHGDTVAGRKIEILKRDDGGVAPETAKRLAQELVVNDKVDFLMGLTVSPNAMGVAAVSTQAKVPLFITNASALGILERNPYAARFSYSEAQWTYPLGHWAVKNNLKSVYSIVLDINPGIDAATSLASLRFATALSVVPSEYSGRIARPPAELFGFVTRARQMPSAPGGTSVPVLARAMVGSLHGQVRRARAVSDEFTETEPASKSLERPWVEPSGPWERAGEGAPAWLALPRRGVGEKYAAAPDLLRR